MNTVYDHAEVLVALIVLGGLASVPDRQGILNRALEKTSSDLPETLQKALFFANTSIGRRALDLHKIVSGAMETGLFEWNGGRMDDLKPKLTINEAREQAIIHGYTTVTFAAIAAKLAAAVNHEMNSMANTHR
jgi:hypothetical protein